MSLLFKRPALFVVALLAVVLGAAPASAQQVAKLTASDGAAGDLFGYPIHVADGLVFIGASLHDEERGAVYVFEQQADGSWEQTTKITADDREPGDWFGEALASDGTHLLVSASRADDEEGVVYVFTRGADDTWQQQARLTLDDEQEESRFGSRAIVLSGDVAIVGSGSDVGVVLRREEEAWIEEERLVPFDATNVHINFTAEMAFDGTYALIGDTAADAPLDAQGAVYVYKRAADGTWTTVTKLTAGDAEERDYFGNSMALCGPDALIGAAFKDEGVVYVFRRNADDTWTQRETLTASDGAPDDRFGVDVACDDRIRVIGAWGKDDEGDNAGAAYLFARGADGTLQEQGRLVVEGLQAGDLFGSPLALYEDEVFVGATEDDEQGENAGAVYVLSLAEATPTEQAAAVPDAFALHGAYPNPFNPQTTIRYALPEAVEVRLAVYDVLGREVAVLVEGMQPAGTHEAVFEATGLPSGSYLYRLEAGAHTETRRMTLVK